MLIILFCFAIIYFGFLQFKISQYSHLGVPDNVDYLIVLGARVKGTTPSLALEERIASAADYLKKNKDTFVIASGGQGAGEDISEAESIKQELMKRGIDKSRIKLEDRSTSTYENIKFSKALLPSSAKSGLIVTNNFHLYRALLIAEDYGLTISGIPAKTPLIAIPKSFSREYLAITKYYLMKIID